MRKIEQKETLERRSKRNKLIIGIILVGLMVVSTAGYALLSSDLSSQQQPLDDLNVTSGQALTVQKNGYSFYLSSTLDQIEDVPVDVSLLVGNYTNKEIFIASSNNIVATELYTVFSRYAYRIQNACYGPCSEDLPEKDCSSLLIVFKPGQVERVTQQDQCVFIEGSMVATDAFLYSLLNDHKV